MPFSPENRQLLEATLLALSQESLPSADYLALLHIHVAMGYAAQLDDTQAGARLDLLGEFPNAPFADLAYEKWVSSQRSTVSFCQAIGQTAQTGEIETTTLTPYLSTPALFRAFGNRYDSAAPFLCPYDALISSRLLAETLSDPENPFNDLAGKPYPWIGITKISLNGDQENAWVTALSARFPPVYLFYRENATWKISHLDTFSDPIQALEVRTMSSPTQASPALFLLATFDASVPVSKYAACWAKGAVSVSQLRVLQMDGTTPVSVQSTLFCDTPPDLSRLLPEDAFHLISESVSPVISPDHAPVFYAHLEQLEADLFRGRNLEEARNGLQELLARVPFEHPSAPQLVPRLLWDIGLSYELEGNTAAARAVYLGLRAEWPASPWAWLAEARPFTVAP